MPSRDLVNVHTRSNWGPSQQERCPETPHHTPAARALPKHALSSCCCPSSPLPRLHTHHSDGAPAGGKGDQRRHSTPPIPSPPEGREERRSTEPLRPSPPRRALLQSLSEEMGDACAGREASRGLQRGRESSGARWPTAQSGRQRLPSACLRAASSPAAFPYIMSVRSRTSGQPLGELSELGLSDWLLGTPKCPSFRVPASSAVFASLRAAVFSTL